MAPSLSLKTGDHTAALSYHYHLSGPNMLSLTESSMPSLLTEENPYLDLTGSIGPSFSVTGQDPTLAASNPLDAENPFEFISGRADIENLDSDFTMFDGPPSETLTLNNTQSSEQFFWPTPGFQSSDFFPNSPNLADGYDPSQPQAAGTVEAAYFEASEQLSTVQNRPSRNNSASSQHFYGQPAPYSGTEPDKALDNKLPDVPYLPYQYGQAALDSDVEDIKPSLPSFPAYNEHMEEQRFPLAPNMSPMGVPSSFTMDDNPQFDGQQQFDDAGPGAFDHASMSPSITPLAPQQLSQRQMGPATSYQVPYQMGHPAMPQMATPMHRPMVAPMATPMTQQFYSPMIQSPIMHVSQSNGARQTMSPDQSQMDHIIVEGRRQGLTYKEIKQRHGFECAESTLRGRYRTITKNKSERVRKPCWEPVDLRLLDEAVIAQCNNRLQADNVNTLTDLNNLGIAWKEVAKYIVANGGTYQFGNSTCKKKWVEKHGLAR